MTPQWGPKMPRNGNQTFLRRVSPQQHVPVHQHRCFVPYSGEEEPWEGGVDPLGPGERARPEGTLETPRGPPWRTQATLKLPTRHVFLCQAVCLTVVEILSSAILSSLEPRSVWVFFPSVKDSCSPPSEPQQKEEKMSKSGRKGRKSPFCRDVLGSAVRRELPARLLHPFVATVASVSS